MNNDTIMAAIIFRAGIFSILALLILTLGEPDLLGAIINLVNSFAGGCGEC